MNAKDKNTDLAFRRSSKDKYLYLRTGSVSITSIKSPAVPCRPAAAYFNDVADRETSTGAYNQH